MFFMKKFQMAFQDTIENTAYRISPTAGDIVSKSNELYNKVTDTEKRLTLTIKNGATSSNISSLVNYLGKEAEHLEVGDHLWVQRIGYTHHGIYYGNDLVIHYLQEGITIDTIDVFADGSPVKRKNKFQSPTCYEPEEIIIRAESRINENSYNLILNNCEHFCHWCRTGN